MDSSLTFSSYLRSARGLVAFAVDNVALFFPLALAFHGRTPGDALTWFSIFMGVAAIPSYAHMFWKDYRAVREGKPSALPGVRVPHQGA